MNSNAPASNRRRSQRCAVVWLISLVCFWLLPAGRALADSDDFNDNSRNTARWGTSDIGVPGGLVEANQRLEYQNATSSDSYTVWGWQMLLPFGQDWEARVKVNVPALSFSADGYAGVGLYVLNGADPTDMVALEFEAGRDLGSNYRQFLSLINVNGVDNPGLDLFAATASTNATFRARWVAATARLLLEYDADGPANGEVWTTLRTFDPAATWGMTSGNFQLGIGGYSGNRAIASGDGVSLDDFTGAVGTPDVASYIVVKGQEYLQTGTGAPTLQTNNPFFFNASASTPVMTNTLISASVRIPGGATRAFTNTASDGNSFSESFANQAAMDAVYSNGTYTVSLSTVHDGSLTNLVLNLTGNAYPNAPRVSNFTAAQTVNAAANFTVTWDALTGGTTNDSIQFDIKSTNGTTVFRTPNIGVAGMLDGTATSALIPAGTLTTGQSYTARLRFAKAVTRDTGNYLGSLGLALYSIRTSFSITAAAVGLTFSTPLILTQNTNIVGAGSITFSSTVNSDATPRTLTVTTSGATTFAGAVGGSSALASLTTDAGGTTAISGGGVTTTGAQTYNDNVVLGASTVLTSFAGGNITFNGNINGTFAGGQSLMVNASGATTFAGFVGGVSALASLATDAGGTTFVEADVMTTGSQTYNDAFVLGANATLTSTAGGSITFNSTISGGGSSLTVFGNAVFSGSASGLSSLAVSGVTTINTSTITSSGTQTYAGAVVLGGDATITGSTVTFGSSLNGISAGAAGLTVVGNANFSGSVGAISALEYVSVSGATALNGPSITTSQIGGGTGNQMFSGMVTIGANVTLNSGGGTVALNGGYSVSIGGTNFSKLTINGSAAFNGALNVTLINGFNPNVGDSFEVIAYTARSGAFTGLNVQNLGDGKVLQASYATNRLVLTVARAMTNGPVAFNNYDANGFSGFPIYFNTIGALAPMDGTIKFVLLAGSNFNSLDPVSAFSGSTNTLNSEPGFFDFGVAYTGVGDNTAAAFRLLAWQGGVGSTYNTASNRAALDWTQNTGTTIPLNPAILTFGGSSYLVIGGVPAGVLISSQPQSRTVYSGANVIFAVSASGAPPLSYQWRKNGSNIVNATNSSYSLANVQAGDAGGYSVLVSNASSSVVSSNAVLTVASGGSLDFRIAGLLTNNSAVVDHDSLTSDDRGGIAVSSSQVFVTGDGATARFNVTNLTGGASLGRIVDGLCADLKTETVYTLGIGTNAVTSAGGTVTTLIELDAATGQPTGAIINLSQSFAMTSAGSGNGIFSGHGRVAIHNGSRVYDVLLPSGTVTDMGAMARPNWSGSESWSVWGVAEYFDGSLRLVYRDSASYTNILRARVPDGSTEVVASFNNLGDMASFTVSPSRGRWYFHYESYAQFGGSYETLGYADAAFNIGTTNPPVFVVQPADQVVLAGGAVTLFASPNGSLPMSYQWRFNGSPLAGATNATLALTNVTTNMAGLYSLLASNANGTAISSNATLAVWPGVSIVPTASVMEGDAGATNLLFNVGLSFPSTQPVSVAFYTSDGSAVSGVDFAGTNGFITFPPGVTNQTIAIPVLGDLLNEDDEYFWVYLSSATNAFLVATYATGTIVDNDPLPVIQFTNISVTEGHFGPTNVTLTVNLSAPSGRYVSVYFATSNATATAGSDYVATNGALTFYPGNTNITLDFRVNGDVQVESGEVFYVMFSGEANALLATNRAAVTIVNDDGFPSQIDHFSWSAIASTQMAGVPFAVTLTAKDYFSNTVTNFNDPVTLNLTGGGWVSTNLLGTASYEDVYSGNYTLGYSFTPAVNLTVTHVRHIFGTKVSIWDDAGVLLASQDVVSTPGTWVETPLGAPVTLTAGTRYRVAAYTGGGSYYYNAVLPAIFAHGTVDGGWFYSGDGFPSGSTPGLYLVDLRYVVGSLVSTALTPTSASPFVNGVWTGAVTVAQAGTNLNLQALDAVRHEGVSATFEVLGPPFVWEQPVNRALLIGGSAQFSAQAGGTAPLKYQWRKNGTPISGATNTSYGLANVQTNDSGLYSVVVSNAYGIAVSSNAVLTVVDAGNLDFQITGLLTNNSAVVDHNGLTGDDRGGIAVSASQVFVTGDNSTARFNATDLTGGASLGQVVDGLCSDLRTEKIYTLGTGTNALTSNGGTATTLIELDGTTGQPTGTIIPLSQPIPMTSGNNGIFSGYGRVVIHNGNGNQVYDILLPSGIVLSLGTMTRPNWYGSESWSVWGVAESFDGSLYLTYRGSGSSSIVRARVPDGAVTNLTVFSNLGDMASFTVSPTRGRWYFHYEGTAQFGGSSETLGYADATFNTVFTNPPVIVAQPANQTVGVGSNATFAVTATGPGPLSYAWQRNGVAIPGANTPNYTAGNLQLADSGSVFRCVVSNAYGATASSNAVLTVVPYPPVITAQPSGRLVLLGNAVTFSVAATGTLPMSYQWRFNGNPLAGATNATLVLNNVTTNQAGAYSVLVTNAYGSAASSNATLTVLTSLSGFVGYFTDNNSGTRTPEPVITSAGYQALYIADISTFDLAQIGVLLLNEYDNNGISSALINRMPEIETWVRAGGRLIVHDRSAGNIANPTPLLPGKTNIVMHRFESADVDVIPPSDTAVTQGPYGTLNNVSLDGGNWSVHGYADYASLPPGARAILSAGSATNQVGAFSYTLGGGVVYYSGIPLDHYLVNASGTFAQNLISIYTPNVLAYVQGIATGPSPPAIVNQPDNQSVVVGDPAAFSVGAVGSLPFGYQWRSNGVNITGATNSFFVLTNAQAAWSGGGYSVVVSNAYGSVTSVVATLTVLVPPRITAQPANQTVVMGGSAIFSVTAGGTAPLAYQWRRDGTNLLGATNTTLTLNLVQPGDAGTFDVVVTNLVGSTSSAAARLTVLAPPIIVTHPASQVVAAGRNGVLGVAVIGPEPFFYQWLFSGTNLPGATNAALLLPNIQPGQAGSYQVIVANYAGSVTSAVATVVVVSTPAITVAPVDRTVSVGDNVTFSVTASGTPPLRYQWRLNGVNLAGATNATLLLFNVQRTNAGTYSVVVANDVGSGVSAEARLVIGFGASVLKDNFADRVFTNSLIGEVKGNNLDATREIGEPNHAGRAGGKSLWLAWTAPVDGAVTFKTEGSGFDTLLAAYTGGDVASLAEVAGNDDLGAFFASRVSFFATGGTTYQIAVDGLGGADGDVELQWELEPGAIAPPKFLAQPQSQTVTNGASVLFTVSFFVSNPSSFTNQWFHNGQPVPGATFTNLLLANVQPAQVGAYRLVVTRTSDGRQFLSELAILELQRPEEGQGVDSGQRSHDKFLDLFTNTVASAAGRQAAPRPPRPAAVTVSAGSLGTQIFSTIGASTEAGEPTVAGAIGGSSVWFSILAASDGVMVVDTIGSDFDTVLGVYLGTDLLNLTEVTSDNNSAPDGIRSRVSFAATNGTTYLIVVDGVNGAQGANAVLNWRLGVPPMLLVSPTNQVASGGGTVTLSVSASGTPPHAYQWRFNGVDILGATNATLSLPDFQLADQGSYSVAVSNTVGVAASAPAFLALDVPAQLSSVSKAGGGAFRLQLAGAARQNYVVQATTNLSGANVVWTSLFTTNSFNGVFDFNDAGAATNSRRFYRVVKP